ncbi:MAG: HD domain-containing protein [Candidatus Riflebacteria bacterium]|nr:HD domain-containing protein [Candidatus Riflebacteria bacterium]
MLIDRIKYWLWKFQRTLFPVIDQEMLELVRKKVPLKWLKHFDHLLSPDKAHVLRLYKAISSAKNIDEKKREKLLILSIAHDLGKGITRPGIFSRVIKVILPIPNRSHPILGARLLKRLGAPPELVKRVARHHIPAKKDTFLKLFQSFDDNV